ncbi:hypothetical protein N7532_005309 [Penicillium argentinense]|uniref:OTU domain-containing protein n=1 Tax=Penicillium argentinense TaxID=1131581 RepID=A0A9W9K9U7_9EURO|nr:uncharacterized protein N7532_005309 [Penicillium argentinense]KAJ5098308.1 hypothetical protein N7532_005309 [Penicillium argentinense]
MSESLHGGRIVPILRGHEQQHLDSTPSTANVLEHHPFPNIIAKAPLLDQREDNMALDKKSLDLKSLEMPCLKERGLFALPTEGDGNCLYYSFSDQLYSNFDHGDEIRQKLADHMANHKSYFMQFVVAEGGERRRPKRSAVTAYATRSADVAAPSDEDKERRFEEMVATTRKNAEWGSSEHLQAFCQVFRVDVNVYTMDGVQSFRDVNASPDEHRDVIHVAFHDFKHYSSVRQIDGTHKGLFETLQAPVLPKQILGDDSKESIDTKHNVDARENSDAESERDIPKHALAATSNNRHSTPTDSSSDSHSAPTDSTNTSHTTASDPANDSGLAVDVFPPWDIQSIQDGLGGRYDRDTIVDMLQKCRGDIDRAFAALLGEKETPAERMAAPAQSFNSSVQMSRESSPFSTGSKRSAEDSGDDSEEPRPAIRRGRPKRRIVSNLTLGVGISFRDDQNEVVSLNIRMKDEGKKDKKANSALEESASELSEAASPIGTRPRRSGRLSKPRAA